MLVTRHVGRRHSTTKQRNMKMFELMMLMMVIIVPIITITIRAMRISTTQSRPKNTRTTAMAVSTIQFRSTAPNRYRTAPNRAATHRTEINRSATPASTPPPLPPPTLHLSNPQLPSTPPPPVEWDLWSFWLAPPRLWGAVCSTEVWYGCCHLLVVMSSLRARYHTKALFSCKRRALSFPDTRIPWK